MQARKLVSEKDVEKRGGGVETDGVTMAGILLRYGVSEFVSVINEWVIPDILI